MKTIVFGDIHGRTVWKDIVSQHSDADRFVFLGDYFTSREGISEEDQIINFTDLVNFADFENAITPGRVILLRGNHDMEALGYEWASCSPWFMSGHYRNKEVRDWFLDHTQWVFVEDGIAYSHAGVTKTWMERNGLTELEQINDLEPSKKFGFTPCKLSDYYGDSVTQPPTWIRPWGLFGDSFGKYTYVVGHTTLKHIRNLKDEMLERYTEDTYGDYDPEVLEEIKNGNDVWMCDTLPHEYLIVEDGEIAVGKFNTEV